MNSLKTAFVILAVSLSSQVQSTELTLKTIEQWSQDWETEPPATREQSKHAVLMYFGGLRDMYGTQLLGRIHKMGEGQNAVLLRKVNECVNVDGNLMLATALSQTRRNEVDANMPVQIWMWQQMENKCGPVNTELKLLQKTKR